MSGWSDGPERPQPTDPWSEAQSGSPVEGGRVGQGDPADQRNGDGRDGARPRLRRGPRIAIGAGTALVVLAVIGIAGRVLAPEPTSDPCAAVPSDPVEEFFSGAAGDTGDTDHADRAGSGADAVRLTLPNSSTQRCVWMLDPRGDADASAYRRLEVTFGLVDGERYLDRMRRRAEHGAAGESGGAADRTVTVVDTDAEHTAFRLATIQSVRTGGAKDVVAQLSAYAMPSGPGVDRIRELAEAMANDLRPMRESVLRDAEGTATRMLVEPSAATFVGRENAEDRLLAEGLDLSDSSECARELSQPLTAVLGEYGASPEARCVWFSDRGNVAVRMGTADHALTARNAYAGLSVANYPYSRLESSDSSADLGADVRMRVLAGRVGVELDSSQDGPRIVEVTAIRGGAVVLVQYWGFGASGGGGETVEPAQAERAALRLARAALDRL